MRLFKVDAHALYKMHVCLQRRLHLRACFACLYIRYIPCVLHKQHFTRFCTRYILQLHFVRARMWDLQLEVYAMSLFMR